MTRPEEVAAAITPRTKLLYCESPANPNMRLIDLAAIAALGFLMISLPTVREASVSGV